MLSLLPSASRRILLKRGGVSRREASSAMALTFIGFAATAFLALLAFAFAGLALAALPASPNLLASRVLVAVGSTVMRISAKTARREAERALVVQSCRALPLIRALCG